MKGKHEPTDHRYLQIVELIFFERYRKGATSIPWKRTDIEAAVAKLGIERPSNFGDVPYYFRYRNPLPKKILRTQPKGMEWIIEGAGKALYTFQLVRINRIHPNASLATVKIPDNTPEIIGAYALSDEQALLARLRYNRLIDIFLGITTYSLQNHLRTTVKGIGQIEIDEIYVGVDRRGCQYVIPVQAKGGSDQLSVVQTKQYLACCAARFPHLQCRAVSAQFMENERIALFELIVEDNEVKVREEKHYRLVPAAAISVEELGGYSVTP